MENRNLNIKENISSKKAYLCGGGIASLATAAFLIKDGQMPGNSINIFEELDVLGGAMDGNGNSNDGYKARGGREIENHFECFKYLYSFIPSLNNPNRSVLDEFRELNIKEPIESHCRLVENCGKKVDFSTLGLSKINALELGKLGIVAEEKLDEITIEQYFEPSFFETNFWCFWRTMFAFETWHSITEFKRYMERFIHLISGMNKLKGILHTEFNQYDSLILPLIKWLESKGVCFNKNCKIVDLDFNIQDNNEKSVVAIHIINNGIQKLINVEPTDLVFITNGSMTENTTIGNLSTAAKLNRSETDRGCWTLWENIANKSTDFGNPRVFCGDIDKTKWMSFTITLKDDDIMLPYIYKLTGDKPGMGGLVTIKDSNWLMSWVVPKDPHFINQPENVKVVWAYGLFPDAVGNYVNKKMSDCTGAELLEELCYHMGLKDKISEILKHTVNVIPSLMPYITSQFMPRKKGDRPEVLPNGSKNFAFIGQFAEVADDCVFTVEYSVRTALTAVYKFFDLESEIIPVYPSKYDIRYLLKAVKTCLGNEDLPLDKSLGEILSGTIIPKILI